MRKQGGQERFDVVGDEDRGGIGQFLSPELGGGNKLVKRKEGKLDEHLTLVSLTMAVIKFGVYWRIDVLMLVPLKRIVSIGYKMCLRTVGSLTLRRS